MPGDSFQKLMTSNPEMSSMKKETFSSLDRLRKKGPPSPRKGRLSNFIPSLSNVNPSKIDPPSLDIDHRVPNFQRHKKPSSETGLISLNQLAKKSSKVSKSLKDRRSKKQQVPMDRLSHISSSMVSRTKPKKSVHIANISSSQDALSSDDYLNAENKKNQRNDIQKEESLIPIADDEVRNLIESSSKIGENTKALISNIEKIKKKNSNNNNKATANTDTIEKLLRSDSITNLLGNDTVDLDDPDNQLTSIDNVIGDDSSKVKKVKEKYKKSMPDFNPPILSKKKILKKADKYLDVIKDILNGKKGSYFYELARQFSTSSPRSIISDIEIINLPKNIYHGYYGQLRQHIIAEYIQNHLKSLLLSKNKFNKVIQFWGTRYFALYALSPEVIARLMVEDMNYSGDALEKAYDEMEATNDYGLYIMDKHDPENRLDDSQKQGIVDISEEELTSDGDANSNKENYFKELNKTKSSWPSPRASQINNPFWKPAEFDDVSSDEGDLEEEDLFNR